MAATRRRKDVSSLSVDVLNIKRTPVFCLLTVAFMHKQRVYKRLSNDHSRKYFSSVLLRRTLTRVPRSVRADPETCRNDIPESKQRFLHRFVVCRKFVAYTPLSHSDHVRKRLPRLLLRRPSTKARRRPRADATASRNVHARIEAETPPGSMYYAHKHKCSTRIDTLLRIRRQTISKTHSHKRKNSQATSQAGSYVSRSRMTSSTCSRRSAIANGSSARLALVFALRICMLICIVSPQGTAGRILCEKDNLELRRRQNGGRFRRFDAQWQRQR